MTSKREQVKRRDAGTIRISGNALSTNLLAIPEAARHKKHQRQLARRYCVGCTRWNYACCCYCCCSPLRLSSETLAQTSQLMLQTVTSRRVTTLLFPFSSCFSSSVLQLSNVLYSHHVSLRLTVTRVSILLTLIDRLHFSIVVFTQTNLRMRFFEFM